MHSSTLTTATHPDSSPTTATVREHACLFTHDLRRKQKRWQDGRLKYHTFNRRVMVYDERGNFVGDTHWRENYDLADGDELELERGGIIIQVGECVGSRDQDLSELIDKRAQEKAQRQAAAAARRPSTTPIAPRHVVKPQPLLQRHLHDVIGTPSGHHGRAVAPRESPYEERQQRQTPLQSDDTRPAKRQRREISPLSKSGYAQNLFGATLTLSGRPLSQVPARHRQSKISQSRAEIASPPSSNTSNHNDFPSVATDTAQIPRNAHSRPSMQIPLQAEDIQPHSSIKPALPPRSSLNVLGEPEEAPALQKMQSKLTVNERKDILCRHSVLDSVSTNRDLGKLRELDKAREQVGPNTDRLDELPTGRASKKIHDKRKLRAANNCIPGHRPQDPTIIDLTDNPADQHQNKPVLDEPRTELIIKPRKKRGLLMISERHTKRASSSESEPVKTRPDTHNLPLPSKAQPSRASSDKGSKKVRSTNTRHKQIDLPKETRKITSQRNRMDECGDDHGNDNYSDDEGCRQLLHIETARYSAEDEDDDEVQCLDQPRSNPGKETRLSSAVGQSDTQMVETCAMETGRRLRPRKRLLADDDSFSNAADGGCGRLPSTRREDNTAVDDMPAPRLAKLGRKSIKSREVIGFMFDEESDTTPSVKQNYQDQQEPTLNPPLDRTVDDEHHKLKSKIGDKPASTEARSDIESQSRREILLAGKEFTTLQRQNNRKPRPPDSEASLMVPTEEVPSATTTTITKQPIPPITNPATRGRKAAKPSDAAGQMPVCPLSVELAGSSSLNQVSRKTNVQGNLDKGSANPMHGFSRANGGPWSREAYDLFDFKRPS